jgi:hypothetical protein
VSNNKRQSDTLTEGDICKYLDIEGESDVNCEESDDFYFCKGVAVVPCCTVLSHRTKFKKLKKNHKS